MRSQLNINPDQWMKHILRNRLQSLLLLLVMISFSGLLGWLIWSGTGLVILLLITTSALIFTPTLSPNLIMRMYHARQLTSRNAPQLINLIGALSEKAGLDKVPSLHYIPSSTLNAFAVGSKNNAALAITDGLLQSLNFREIAGVCAHEISHIRNNDLRIMGLADLFSRITVLLSLLGQLLLLINLPLILLSTVTINWFAIILLIIAPNLSALAQLALSRTREFDADLGAAMLTGDVDGLASALAKIERVQGNWVERIFFPSKNIPEPSLLRTHPETSERIKRLISLKPEMRAYNIPPITANGAQSSYDAVTRPPRRHITGLWH